MIRNPTFPVLKKLTKKQTQEVLQKVMGDWRVVNLDNDEMLKAWDQLKERKPYYSTSSLHVSEDRYRLGGKTYHVFWQIGDKSHLPIEIGIREAYKWKLKKNSL